MASQGSINRFNVIDGESFEQYMGRTSKFACKTDDELEDMRDAFMELHLVEMQVITAKCRNLNDKVKYFEGRSDGIQKALDIVTKAGANIMHPQQQRQLSNAPHVPREPHSINKVCRHFAKGVCTRGHLCEYKHTQTES